MGTNYYLVCKCCGSEIYHIGKNGTMRNFETMNHCKFTMKLQPNLIIKSECDVEFTFEEIVEIFKNSSWTERNPKNVSDYS